MFKKILVTLVVLVTTLAFADSAKAVPITIDFSSGSYSSVGPGVDNRYTEDGFLVYAPNANHLDSGPNHLDLPYLLFHEGAGNPVNNVITLSYGGASFDFISFDMLLDYANVPGSTNTPLLVTASDGSTFTTSLGYVGTYTLNWTDITWVTFDAISNYVDPGVCCANLIDNIYLDNEPYSVPEPSTLLLLGSGLAGLGYVRRKLRG